MKFDTKYRFSLWKSYIDRGRGLTSYFNELLLIFGFWGVTKNQSPLYFILALIGYAIGCFLLGWAYFRYGWQKAETEVQNKQNLFVEEMRKKFK